MDLTIWVVVGFIIGVVLPIIFAKWLPNSLFHNWGVKVGRVMSATMRNKITVGNWEGFENKLTGSFLAFAQGVKDGADEDDTKTKEKGKG